MKAVDLSDLKISKIRENKKKKKESLFNAAYKLFTTKGFHKTSISDIAFTAGVAKGTFYLYFKDKYDIRNQLIKEKSSALADAAYRYTTSKNPPSFEDRVIYFVDYMIDRMQEDKDLLRFIAKNLSWGILKGFIVEDEKVTESSPDKNSPMEEIYHKMLTEDGIHIKSPEVLIFMIMELVSGTCYNSILENTPVPVEELKPDLYDAIRAIIKTQTDTSSSPTPLKPRLLA